MRLVYLQFSPNPMCVQVVDKAPEGVTVDLKKKTWDFSGSSMTDRGPKKIGNGRNILESRHGVIGVYDTDKITHLGSMVYDAVESQRDRSNAD